MRHMLYNLSHFCDSHQIGVAGDLPSLVIRKVGEPAIKFLIMLAEQYLKNLTPVFWKKAADFEQFQLFLLRLQLGFLVEYVVVDELEFCHVLQFACPVR